jgi:predicted  nucleic acid-binding Zn-ribbon protein
MTTPFENNLKKFDQSREDTLANIAKEKADLHNRHERLNESLSNCKFVIEELEQALNFVGLTVNDVRISIEKGYVLVRAESFNGEFEFLKAEKHKSISGMDKMNIEAEEIETKMGQIFTKAEVRVDRYSIEENGFGFLNLATMKIYF